MEATMESEPLRKVSKRKTFPVKKGLMARSRGVRLGEDGKSLEIVKKKKVRHVWAYEDITTIIIDRYHGRLVTIYFHIKPHKVGYEILQFFRDDAQDFFSLLYPSYGAWTNADDDLDHGLWFPVRSSYHVPANIFSWLLPPRFVRIISTKELCRIANHAHHSHDVGLVSVDPESRSYVLKEKEVKELTYEQGLVIITKAAEHLKEIADKHLDEPKNDEGKEQADEKKEKEEEEEEETDEKEETEEKEEEEADASEKADSSGAGGHGDINVPVGIRTASLSSLIEEAPGPITQSVAEQVSSVLTFFGVTPGKHPVSQLSELVQRGVTAKRMEKSLYRAFYTAADSNGSGNLDHKEVRACVAELGKALHDDEIIEAAESEEAFEENFRSSLRDDGGVSLEEFYDIMHKVVN